MMKRLSCFGIILVLMFGMCSNVVAEDYNIRVAVNGSIIYIRDHAPYINAESRTMVPASFVTNNLGCQISYGSYGTVFVQNQDVKISFYSGTYKASVTNLKTNQTRLRVFDTKFFGAGSNTIFPLRFLTEAIHAKVEWDETAGQINISTAGNFTDSEQPIYYNHNYFKKKPERVEYVPEQPFEVEYTNTTKEELDKSVVLRSLSQLPNLTYVSRFRDNTGILVYSFHYNDINKIYDNNLDSVFFLEVSADFKTFEFTVEKNDVLARGLLRNTLSILLSGNQKAQDAAYKQILEQRAYKVYTRRDVTSNCRVVTDTMSVSKWGRDAFKVRGFIIYNKKFSSLI